MGLPPSIEGCLGTLLSSQKGRDAKLLTSSPSFPPPSLTITSPDCGPSGSTLPQEYSQLGTERFPPLTWTLPPNLSAAAEYLITVEDPDAPLPSPIVHGLYYSIPGSVTEFGGEEVQNNTLLKEGKLGKNRRGDVYLGPRPVLDMKRIDIRLTLLRWGRESMEGG